VLKFWVPQPGKSNTGGNEKKVFYYLSDNYLVQIFGHVPVPDKALKLKGFSLLDGAHISEHYFVYVTLFLPVAHQSITL
jgi:hypothetical protein